MSFFDKIFIYPSFYPLNPNINIKIKKYKKNA